MQANAFDRLRLAHAARATDLDAVRRRRLVRTRRTPSLRRRIGHSLIRLGERLATEPSRSRSQ